MNAPIIIVLVLAVIAGMLILPAQRADQRDARPCYCGGLYDCEDCGYDTCKCECDKDGAPQTQAEVTAGYTNPRPGIDAWAEKEELTR